MRIVGHNKEANGLEKIALGFKFTGGASRFVSGVSGFIEDGDFAKNGLSIGVGVLKMGNSCFQYRALKKYEEIKSMQEDVTNKINESNKKIEFLTKERENIELLLNKSKENYCDCEEYKKYQLTWDETVELEKSSKQQRVELKREQEIWDMKVLGFDCAEGVCISSYEDFENGEDLKKSLIKNIQDIFKKWDAKFFLKQ